MGDTGDVGGARGVGAGAFAALGVGEVGALKSGSSPRLWWGCGCLRVEGVLASGCESVPWVLGYKGAEEAVLSAL